MPILKVAGLQMPVSRVISENEARILAAIENARRDAAHFLLTPEGSLSGYHADFDQKALQASLDRVTAFAKRSRVGLLLGTCFRETSLPGSPLYNQVRVYSPEGGYLGFHSKILRCQRLDRPADSEVALYSDSPLRTFDCNGLRFGALICNDLWATPGFTRIPNPYLPLKLKEMGARLIFHSVNTGPHTPGDFGRTFHEVSVSQWARALAIHIVEANATAPDGKPTNARSGVVAPDGSRLLLAPDTGEQYFSCDIPC